MFAQSKIPILKSGCKDSVKQPEKKKKKRKHEVEEEHTVDLNLSPLKKEKKKKRKNNMSARPTDVNLIALPVAVAAENSYNPTSVEIEAFLLKHSITIHTPPSQSGPSPIPIISFSQFTSDIIPSKLSSAFTGFKEPTPVQACTWPPALQGQDVVGIAETGSGKTLAFGIPALARLLSLPSSDHKISSSVTVLVVAPTRELALQTHDTLSALGEPFGIASVAIFGGVDKGPQIKSLGNANKDGKITRIVVGTPGRILDLVNDGACDLSR